jgi:hypothetical protein
MLGRTPWRMMGALGVRFAREEFSFRDRATASSRTRPKSAERRLAPGESHQSRRRNRRLRRDRSNRVRGDSRLLATEDRADAAEGKQQARAGLYPVDHGTRRLLPRTASCCSAP